MEGVFCYTYVFKINKLMMIKLYILTIIFNGMAAVYADKYESLVNIIIFFFLPVLGVENVYL